MNNKTRGQFLQGLRLNLKLTGWWPAVVSALFISVFYIFTLLSSRQLTAADPIYQTRLVETIVPLAFAVQAAFLLGPDNEPALELLVSYPKTITRSFSERLLLAGIMHIGVALVATLVITATWHVEDILLQLMRWLAAGIALGGVAIFTTQLTRQSTFGTLMAILLWVASLYGGDELMKIWSWFWPFHVYLQPDKFSLSLYWLNRLSLTTIGAGLTLLALTFLKDEDRLLGSR
jgi:hypothetical protein